MDIYSGKDTEASSSEHNTLGERVVIKLVQHIPHNKDISICFDRFFISVNLINNLPFAVVGTVMKNRKNIPKLETNMNRGESEILGKYMGPLVQFGKRQPGK